VSGTGQCAAFAFGVPQDINGFHPYTLSSAHLSCPLSNAVSFADPRLSRGLLQMTNITTYSPFTPSNSG